MNSKAKETAPNSTVYSVKRPQANVQLNVGFKNLKLVMKVSKMKKALDGRLPFTTNN